MATTSYEHPGARARVIELALMRLGVPAFYVTMLNDIDVRIRTATQQLLVSKLQYSKIKRFGGGSVPAHDALEELIGSSRQ